MGLGALFALRSAQRSGTGLLVHLFNTTLDITLCAPTLEGSGKTVSFEGGRFGMKKEAGPVIVARMALA
ncbi:hypothetical protein AERO8C_160040 [Aeromonas veronii]|uniref:Uncharacterized protein n=1 Tax=Aeromonas veronii TaxID=654 RepID=A0A653KX53_AERVE|nr:hypothetical protein AERO8C_160040 [Aeromonas veronii]